MKTPQQAAEKPDFKNDAQAVFNDAHKPEVHHWPEFMPDEEEIIYWQGVYIKGCDHGYSVAMDQHRDFYLLVREYFIIKNDLPKMKFDPQDEINAAHEHLKQIIRIINQHLSSFTEREQPKD